MVSESRQLATANGNNLMVTWKKDLSCNLRLEEYKFGAPKSADGSGTVLAHCGQESISVAPQSQGMDFEFLP